MKMSSREVLKHIISMPDAALVARSPVVFVGKKDLTDPLKTQNRAFGRFDLPLAICRRHPGLEDKILAGLKIHAYQDHPDKVRTVWAESDNHFAAKWVEFHKEPDQDWQERLLRFFPLYDLAYNEIEGSPYFGFSQRL